MIALVVLQLAAAYVHEPFASYSHEDHRGFIVYVSAAARANTATTAPALALLDKQLQQIEKIVPSPALKTLRRIPIFLEQMNPDITCASYHHSRDWLREHDYIPEKCHAVEISNPKNYVDWIHLNQPFMTLHELSHGYHDLTVGHEDPYIAACWRNAVACGKYDSVKHNQGDMRKAYALTNPAEYFAELSEAYFGENDFYPFKRDELKKFDPKGYEMIERCWGVSSTELPDHQAAGGCPLRSQ
jgi:hypothetical protein